jgi:ABC-2 type transport system permease protein
MRDLWLVALRELRERVRSKAFLASTIFTLLLVLGAIAVVVLVDDEGPETYTIGVVGDLPGVFDDSLDVAATLSDVVVDTIPQASRESAEAALEDGRIDAALLDVETVLLDGPGGRLETVLTLALQQTQFLERLREAGIGTDQALELLVPGSRIQVENLATDEQDEAAFGVAVFGVILLFLVITTYGQWVLVGVLEEKTNRVVELVAAAVPIRTLLAGKVIGIGVLGLVQMLVLIGLAMGSGLTLDLFDLPDTAVPVAVWALVWFLLGFAFYAVINAAAGSLVSRQEDAQTAAMPIAIVLVASYLATFILILPEPGGPAAAALSQLPPVAPIAFPARVAFGAVAPWELTLGVVVMVAAIYGVITVAARVYTGALLQTGARVKARQAWRAARDVAGG